MMQTSFSNKQGDSVWNLFAYTIGRFRGILLFYSLLLAVFGPLAVFVQALTNQRQTSRFFGNFTDGLVLFLPLVMALLMPLLIFGYVNNKQALDVFHAAPIRRSTLYLGGYLAGLVLILAPLAVFGGGMGLVRPLFAGQMSTDFLWLFHTAISAFYSYSIMVFVMINCGTLFETILYYAALNAGYPILLSAGIYFFERQTFGFLGWSDATMERLYSLSPYYILVQTNESAPYPILLALGTILLGAAFAVLGGILYRRRKSESAGQSFAYKPIFYVGAVLVAGSAGMGFFTLMDSANFGMALLAAIIGILVYFILDTIRNRGFRKILRTAVVAGGVALAFAAFFAAGNFTGAFGFEKRIPAASAIKSVEIEVPIRFSNYYADEEFSRQTVTLTDPENIQLVLDFHHTLVANRKMLENYYPYGNATASRSIELVGDYDHYAFDDGTYALEEYGLCNGPQLTYHLEGGGTMTRTYGEYPLVLNKPLYQLFQSEEYQRAYIEASLVYLRGTPIKSLTCRSLIAQDEKSVDLEQTQVEELYAALRQDMAQRPEGFLVAPQTRPLYTLWVSAADYRYGSNGGEMPIFAEDVKTLELLEEWRALPRTALDNNATEIVGYLPLEKQKETMDYPQRQLVMFYVAGTYPPYGDNAEKYAEGSPESRGNGYKPRFVTLTGEQFQNLWPMITPIRFAEQGGDVVLYDSRAYLVYPQYEDAVRELLLSAPEQ